MEIIDLFWGSATEGATPQTAAWAVGAVPSACGTVPGDYLLSRDNRLSFSCSFQVLCLEMVVFSSLPICIFVVMVLQQPRIC